MTLLTPDRIPAILRFQDVSGYGRLLSAGIKLGRYEIRSKIGEGGMGEVYRAFDPTVNREVAIKILASWPFRRQGSPGAI